MKLIFLFVGLAVFFLLGWMLLGGEGIEEVWNVERVVGELEKAKGWAWVVGVLLLVADLLLPVPGTVVMSALGAVYGVFLGGVFASVGNMLAGIAGYGFGRFFKEGTARRWLGERDFERGKELFGKQGGWVVAVSRAVPILPEALACMAGLLRMRFCYFLFALACGAVPMGFLFSWIGSFGESKPLLTLGMSVILPLLLWFSVNRLRAGRR